MRFLSLTTTQFILVLSALVWGIFPLYGAPAFAGALALLAVALLGRERGAARIVAQSAETLSTLSEESKALVARFPVFYVWTNEAKQWGKTLLMTGLLCILLGGWFLVRGLLTQQYWQLAYVLGCFVVLIAATQVARRFNLDDRFKEDAMKSLAPAHKACVTHLSLKHVAGRWPPVPAPEEEKS
jgi:hypothetical protein